MKDGVHPLSSEAFWDVPLLRSLMVQALISAHINLAQIKEHH